MMEPTASIAPLLEPKAPPAGRLYAPGQIFLASLLGSPLAAGWFLSRNERTLGEPEPARWWLAGGVLGTLAVIALAFLLPVRLPALPLVYSLALYQAARQVHGEAVARHRAAGGRLGSWWRVVGVSLLFCLLILVLFLLIEDLMIGPWSGVPLQGPVAIRR